MKRPSAHVIKTKSENLLRTLIPSEWIVRRVSNDEDYGVDFEIELVDQTKVTGKRIWIQLKGAEQVSVRTVSLGPKSRVECISFPLETNEINYSLECSFPLLLFIAAVRLREIYWLPIRDDVANNLNKRTPRWREQITNTLWVPKWNSLSNEHKSNYPGLRWYALEPARMYAFALLHHLYHEFQCAARLFGYRIGAGLIDDAEEEELRSSLALARQALSIALGIDILFGKNVAAPFVIQAVNIKQAIHSSDVARAQLESHKYSLSSLSPLLAAVGHGIEAISAIINMYPMCSMPYTLNESSIAFRTNANK